MEYAVDIYLLSAKFMSDYPEFLYPEIMRKSGRPYTCLMIDLHEDYLICIPFRSAIPHKNAFLFTGTQRSRRSRSGLDYSKVVLIKDSVYLDSAHAVVDQDEYREAMRNMPQIVREIAAYIDKYIRHIRGTAPLHPREYERTYQFSTLPYFHDIMKLP